MQHFALNSDYIFFTQSVLQENISRYQISIAMKKKMENYKLFIKALVNKDRGYNFINKIRGTPTYWKILQYEVLAIINQLGFPIFFLTLSCADLKWREIPEIISKLNELNFSKENLDSMNYY